MGKLDCVLRDGHGLSGERRFVHLQVAGGYQAHIRGNFIPRLKQNNISGNHLCRRYLNFLARTHDRGFRDHRFRQRFHGLDSLGLLYEPYEGINDNHPENNSGIHPFLEQGRNGSGRQQDVYQRLMKLQEKSHQGTFAFFGSQYIYSESLFPVTYFQQIESLVWICLQKTNNLFMRHMVPVFSQQFFHAQLSFR
ncbi:hypothetical protein ASZ90_008611 [hydrocarbon metagenome]|uniref:Uncharacterized protein n=1 Tax=hydrocarbon metagenome TaxID=938273 RepID=A0A0W8FL84_9ZZZZ